MHIYTSHLDGFYTLNERLDFDALYCEQCGDWDNYIGECSTANEARELINSSSEAEYYDRGTIEDFIAENFNNAD